MPRFHGLFTALFTPFTAEDALDERAFRAQVEWQIQEGVHGLVPCGTTGESPTLTHEEHKRLIAWCVETANGRVPVMAGTGSNSTREAIEFTQYAQESGADAVLVVAPYYNKPTQEGVYQHYKAIHDASSLPIFIYNIPGRSVIDIRDETLARLSELPRIAGVKDATGDLARVCTLSHLVTPDFNLLSGEDMTAVGFNAQGGVGCISVTANIAPKQCAAVQNATLAGDFATARRLHTALVPLHKALFLETNPAPVKYAASLLKHARPEVRLPLVMPSAATQTAVQDAMRFAGLL
jgi:4-hydroxy-tetrahydrodipicolinate synthase